MRYVHRGVILVPLVMGMMFMRATQVAFAADPTSGQLLQEALTAAAAIDGADEQADMLSDIAMAQARTGEIAGAKRTAQSITVELKRNFAYGHVAEALARTGDIDGAMALLDVVGNSFGKAGLYAAVAEAQARKGDIAAARATVDKISNRFFQAKTNERIALAQAATGHIDDAAAAVATIAGADDVKAEAYVILAEMKAKAGDAAAGRQMMDLARTAAGRLPGYLAPLAWARIAAGETELGNLPAAMRIADDASTPRDKAYILSCITSAQIEIGDIAGAKSTGASITDDGSKTIYDVKLAAALAKKGDTDGARELLKEADAMNARVTPPARRAISAQGIGTAQVQVNGAETAAAWARSQTDPDVRVRALLGVVWGLPDYHGPDLP